MRRFILFSALILAVAAAAVIFCINSVKSEEQNIALRYASVPAIVEAPAHVAQAKGFFADEGLDIEWRLNPDGKTSLEQLLEGNVDIASVTSTPVVYSSLKRDDFCIIAQINHHVIHSATANRKSGISSIEDLKGKRAAVMLGTSGQFFMESWMTFNGIKQNELEIVNYNAPEAVKAIEEGLVDVMFYWFPFPAYAEKRLGENALVFGEGEIASIPWVIVVRKDYLAQNGEVVRRFLKAVMKAEGFIRNEPDKAMHLHSELSGVPEDITGRLFAKMSFDLSLNQVLLLDLESQARWLISREYTDAEAVPNYMDFISSGPLRDVKPQSVTLIERSADED